MTVEDVNIYQSITFYHKTLMLGSHNTVVSIYRKNLHDFTNADSQKIPISMQINQETFNHYILLWSRCIFIEKLFELEILRKDDSEKETKDITEKDEKVTHDSIHFMLEATDLSLYNSHFYVQLKLQKPKNWRLLNRIWFENVFQNI